GIRDGHVTGVQTCALPISTLGRLRAAVALPQMVLRINDDSDLVRLSLAQALGEFGGSAPKLPPRVRVRRNRVWRLWTSRHVFPQDRKSVVEGKRVDLRTRV